MTVTLIRQEAGGGPEAEDRIDAEEEGRDKNRPYCHGFCYTAIFWTLQVNDCAFFVLALATAPSSGHSKNAIGDPTQLLVPIKVIFTFQSYYRVSPIRRW